MQQQTNGHSSSSNRGWSESERAAQYSKPGRFCPNWLTAKSAIKTGGGLKPVGGEVQELCECAKSGNVDGVQRLATKENVNKTCRGLTPLMWLAFYREKEVSCGGPIYKIANHLIRQMGAKASKADRCGRTALHYAVMRNNVRLASAIYSCRGDTILDLMDRAGNTALMHAAAMDNEKSALFLLSVRASVDKINDDGYTALSLAKKYKCWPTAFCLIPMSQPTNKSCRKYPSRWFKYDLEATQLRKLVCRAMPNTVDIKATVTEQNCNTRYKGRTLLMWAASCQSCWAGPAQGLQALLEAKANAELQDFEGNNVFHWAAMSGNTASLLQLANFLVDSHKKLMNSQNKFGQTPLMLAAWRGHEAAVSFLISRDADVSIADYNGRSAASYACGNSEILIMLKPDTPVDSNSDSGSDTFSETETDTDISDSSD